MFETVNRESPAVAKRHSSRRCSPDAIALGRCGGVPVGTNTTWSRSAHSMAASAAARWPRWIGSKVPPSTPNLMRCPRKIADLVGSSRLVLELRRSDTHRVAGLHACGLEGRADPDAVELDLEPFQRAVRIEVRPLNQALDPVTVDAVTPRKAQDCERSRDRRQLRRHAARR